MSWRVKGLLLMLAVIIADQVSKWWIVTQTFGDKSIRFVPWLFQKGPQIEFATKEVTSFLNMVMVWNPGVSFGMLQTGHGFMAMALTVIAIFVSVGFVAWMWREPSKIRAVSVGLIVGGALGNVWDRLRFGAVADFVDLHVAGHHWPAFNIADSAIVVGVMILLIETFFLNPRSA